MKFKTPLLGAAAAAIAFSAVTVSASSAQAFLIPGSVLNISGNVQALPNSATPTGFEFSSVVGNSLKTTIGASSNGSFAGLAGTEPSIQNLTLAPSVGTLFSSGPVVNFITGIGGGISFDLTEFIYNSSNSSATFNGFFKSGGDSIAANGGLFTSQLTSFNPATYSASIAAIPTPAMLPGLIGLGMGMLRKRKKETAAASAEV